MPKTFKNIVYIANYGEGRSLDLARHIIGYYANNASFNRRLYQPKEIKQTIPYMKFLDWDYMTTNRRMNRAYFPLWGIVGTIVAVIIIGNLWSALISLI